MKRSITFRETPGSKSPSESTTNGTGMPKNSKDHRGWAAWWGDQCVRAIARASTRGVREFTALDERHAVRAARLAFWHAARAKKYLYWDSRWTKEIVGEESIVVDGSEK